MTDAVSNPTNEDDESEAVEGSSYSGWNRSDTDILAEARTRRKAADDAEGDNVLAGTDDLNFLVGGENQWDPKAVAARRLDGRPIITVNSLPTYLHQVTNDQRMNTPAIKVHPTSHKISLEAAKVRQGMIRHIEYESNADVAYQTGVNSAAAIGFGYLRLITDYENEKSFNQKIMFQRIRNAMSVRIDPLNVEPDGSGMKYCFIDLKMAKNQFKKEYPDATAGTSTVYADDPGYEIWLTETEVLVCDYYTIEYQEETVILLSDGTTVYESEMPDNLPANITEAKRRNGFKSRVMLYKITALDILERTEIKCQWIPVFPVYGDEIDIEGKIVRSGIIRHAKGPAQMYNVCMTSATEEVALRSKTPYIGAIGAFKGMEKDWQQANNRAFAFLEYNPVSIEGSLAPQPRRNEMADVPVGFLALSGHAADNIKKTTGLFDASLGARGTATSGVQEKAQIHEGDVANYHYADGLLRTIRHVGRCLNCMISAYYDTERVVKIMGDDNKASFATINKVLDDGKMHDMSCDDYDITVTAGASYSTLRQESAEFLAKGLQSAKDPATAAVFGYLAVKNSDFPESDTATKMLETLLPPQAQQAIPKVGDDKEQTVQTSKGPLPVSQVPQALAAMEQHIQHLTETLQKVDQTKAQTEAMRQQQVVNEQQLEPQRLAAENAKTAAAMKSAEAAAIQAQAALAKAQADAAAAPMLAHADLIKAETDNATAQVKLLDAQTKAQVDAAEAHAEALNGDATALEAWKATLESETRLRVTAMMTASQERIAHIKASQPKGTQHGNAT